MTKGRCCKAPAFSDLLMQGYRKEGQAIGKAAEGQKRVLGKTCTRQQSGKQAANPGCRNFVKADGKGRIWDRNRAAEPANRKNASGIEILLAVFFFFEV